MATPEVPPSNTDQEARERREKRRRAAQRRLTIAFPFLLVLVFVVYAFQTNYIPTESMLPTLKPGDHIVTMRSWLAYPGGRLPAVGDIIVFLRRSDPSQESARLDDPASKPGRLRLFREPAGTEVLIKRVVAVEGDTVAVVGADVYVNGQLQRPWWEIVRDPAGSIGAFYGVLRPVKLGPGEMFVLGDNRGNSDDSRFWGPVKRSEVLGRFVRVLYNEGPNGPNARRAAAERTGDQ